MVNNPLLAIISGIDAFCKQVETGDLSSMHPDIKEAMDKLTPEQREEIKKQAMENVDITDGIKKVKQSLEDFKNTTNKMNHGKPN